MICHRTSEYREYAVYVPNGNQSAKIKPPQSLMLSTSRHSQYGGLYSDQFLNDRPIDGAGVIDHDVRGCAECGWILEGPTCRHCGRHHGPCETWVHAVTNRDSADVPRDSEGMDVR